MFSPGVEPGPPSFYTDRSMTDRNTISIDTFSLGAYQTNCYIVRTRGGDGSGSCWVADAGDEIGPMLDRLGENGSPPEAFVLTHAHLDHIAGLREATKRFPGVPVWIHEAEEAWLGDPELNLSAFAGMPVTGPAADRLLRDGEEVTLGGEAWRVLHTPGHSPGGVALYHAGSSTCISGDAIFNGSVGRTDFPGSSFETLAESIREKIYTLPDETVLLPGHGPATTVGHEKRTNPFVRG